MNNKAEARQALIHAYNLLCPTGEDQRKLIAAIHEAEDAGESTAFVIRQIVHALVDGLDYGNWPSALAKQASL